MPPRNSKPQICVISVNKYVDKSLRRVVNIAQNSKYIYLPFFQ